MVIDFKWRKELNGEELEQKHVQKKYEMYCKSVRKELQKGYIKLNMQNRV